MAKQTVVYLQHEDTEQPKEVHYWHTHNLDESPEHYNEKSQCRLQMVWCDLYNINQMTKW